MPGGDKERIEKPDAPGWYPDPWSATGEGERYFDGKRWGTSAKPLARHTKVPVESAPLVRRTRGRLRRSAVPIGIFVAFVAIAYGVPRLRSSHSSAVVTGPVATAPTTAGTVPNHPARSPEAAHPLGTPAPVPAVPGKFETIEDQPGDPNTPVAWDPCRPIHYVINPAGAPADGTLLIEGAIARVHTATGLQFVYDGTSTEKPSKARPTYQPARYDPTRWAPVLIAWSDEDAFPDLAGYVAGLTDSLPVYASDTTRLLYVSGQIVFDRRDLSMATAPDRGEVRAIVLHELGHLVGLDHTADRTQIMFSESQFNVRDYGAGDLRGLAELGRQACFPGT